MTIGSMPLYKTKPPERSYAPHTSSSYGLNTEEVTTYKNNDYGNWQAVEDFQKQKMFDENMAFRSDPSQKESNQAYSSFWHKESPSSGMGVLDHHRSFGQNNDQASISDAHSLNWMQGVHPPSVEEIRRSGIDQTSIEPHRSKIGMVGLAPYSANIGQWEGIQEQQTQQMFNINMAYRSPVREPEQLALMQQPRQNSPKLEPRVLQAGFIPMEPYPMQSHLMEIRPEVLKKMVNNDFLKNVPKGVGKVVKGIFSMMMVDMSDRPGAADPKKEFKTLCHNLGKLYDEKLQIQDPNSFASKAGRFTGEMLAFGAGGKVIRVAEGRSLFATASEGGLYGAIIAEAHDTNKFAGVAFGFAGGGVGHCVGGVFAKIAKPTPLTDRALVKSSNSMPQTVYHSGFDSLKNFGTKATSLVKRDISQIQNYQLQYVQKGHELEWWKKATVEIDRYRMMYSNTQPKQFYNAVRREFASKNLNEIQTRRVLKYSGFNTYAKPNGLPANVVVEFSKKNGGMTFRKLGTTTDDNLVVRICPGLAEESIVSSVIKGNHLNGKMRGTLRQQTPYVVQRKGNLTLTKDGNWIDLNHPSNKGKEALTHIPLETYKFKGWE